MQIHSYVHVIMSTGVGRCSASSGGLRLQNILVKGWDHAPAGKFVISGFLRLRLQPFWHVFNERIHSMVLAASDSPTWESMLPKVSLLCVIATMVSSYGTQRRCPVFRGGSAPSFPSSISAGRPALPVPLVPTPV